jgi:16S rRNA (cytidine1402-2'-O)-methyltransferase
LQLSGLASGRFSFIGFLPPKSGARRRLLEAWACVPGALVAFETGPRLVDALGDIAAVMPGRRVAVARELTKLYEEVRSGLAEELLTYYEEHGKPKGEIVLVLEPPGACEYSQEELEVMLEEALERMSTKDAAAHVAARTGRAKKALYDLALGLAK